MGTPPPPGPLADDLIGEEEEEEEKGRRFESELAASAVVGRPAADAGFADFATPAAAAATIVMPSLRGLPSAFAGGGDSIMRPLSTSTGGASCEDELCPRGWKRRPES